MSADDIRITRYGFSWNGCEIIRCAAIGRRLILTVHRNGVRHDVYISATGRSVRVFRNRQKIVTDDGECLL